MSPIHKKSALAQTVPLILAAHDRGESLLWGRYEEQLPLCAFTANGLNCRKCFQGPCRINPFGDQPTCGVCGADRDQIVMENLFQTTLEGILETLRSISPLDEFLPKQEIFDLDSDLPRKTRERLSAHGILPIRKARILEVRNGYFSHKGYLSQTLRDLTRMGLLHYGYLKDLGKRFSSSSQDESLVDPDGANLLIVGQPPFHHLLAIREKIRERARGKKVNLWLQGTRGIPAFPSIPDHGSPEIALGMGVDALLLYPNAFFPSLEGLADKWGIPVLLAEEARTIEAIGGEAIEMALDHRKKNAALPPPWIPSPDPIPRASILDRVKEVQSALIAGRIKGVLVIWAEPTVKQAFFARTLTLMENALDQDFLVLAGGDIAAQPGLLDEELSRKTGKKPVKIHGTQIECLNYLSSWAEIPKLVAFLRALDGEKEFHQMPVLVSLPEISRTSTWAMAVSFLSLGFAVQIGARLPFWGSPSLTAILLKDWPQISGGILLASPSLPDGPTQALEMISHFQSRSLKNDRPKK
jgi:hypothetical protein